MTTTYQQPSAERCVRSMKKSGKLAVAILLLAAGALLLLFGNRVGKDKSANLSDRPAEAEHPTVEEYRAELESRMEAICSRVAGVGQVEVVAKTPMGVCRRTCTVPLPRHSGQTSGVVPSAQPLP